MNVLGKVVRTMPVAASKPLVGWRAWRSRSESGSARLYAVFSEPEYVEGPPNDEGWSEMTPRPWVPGEPFVAHCEKCTTPPGKACECGIYAYKSLEDAHKMNRRSRGDVVYGEVALWGKVFECDGDRSWGIVSGGYRAQYASPRLFCSPSGSVCRTLCEDYGCECLSWTKAMARVQETHNRAWLDWLPDKYNVTFEKEAEGIRITEDGALYQVRMMNGRLSCSCAAFRRSRAMCWHTRAVARLRNRLEDNKNAKAMRRRR